MLNSAPYKVLYLHLVSSHRDAGIICINLSSLLCMHNSRYYGINHEEECLDVRGKYVGMMTQRGFVFDP